MFSKLILNMNILNQIPSSGAFRIQKLQLLLNMQVTVFQMLIVNKAKLLINLPLIKGANEQKMSLCILQTIISSISTHPVALNCGWESASLTKSSCCWFGGVSMKMEAGRSYRVVALETKNNLALHLQSGIQSFQKGTCSQIKLFNEPLNASDLDSFYIGDQKHPKRPLQHINWKAG